MQQQTSPLRIKLMIFDILANYNVDEGGELGLASSRSSNTYTFIHFIQIFAFSRLMRK